MTIVHTIFVSSCDSHSWRIDQANRNTKPFLKVLAILHFAKNKIVQGCLSSNFSFGCLWNYTLLIYLYFGQVSFIFTIELYNLDYPEHEYSNPIKPIKAITAIIISGGVSKSMLKQSRLNFDKIEKCE
ncbi:hypothetical protein V5I80_14050 [Acinetobacter radioresistens]|uniref:hypothetical protein n=1 Tax=Acinetobacter radioresistens TaxID=40216 RepID=UPI002FCDB63F